MKGLIRIRIKIENWSDKWISSRLGGKRKLFPRENKLFEINYLSKEKIAQFLEDFLGVFLELGAPIFLFKTNFFLIFLNTFRYFLKFDGFLNLKREVQNFLSILLFVRNFLKFSLVTERVFEGFAQFAKFPLKN